MTLEIGMKSMIRHDKMGKGVTLTETELRKLKELLDAEIAFFDNSTSS